MNILITGAKGFIGSHLGNYLVDKGMTVFGIDNDSHPSKHTTRFSVSIAEAKEADVKGYDAIVHLAAHINVDESLIKPFEYFENNVQQTIQLLEKIRLDNPTCLCIFASSAEVYGSAQYIPMTEDHPLVPQSPYAETKRVCEQYCEMYRELYGLRIKVIRNFNAFGDFQHDGVYGGVISKFKRLAKEGKYLPVYGTGEQVRDYVHISYLIECYFQALTRKDFPNLIHIGSGTSVKIIDIARIISKRFDVAIQHEPPRLGEIAVLQADTSHLVGIGLSVYESFFKDLDVFLDK